MSKVLLSVQNLKTSFITPNDVVKAVDGISFEIQAGESFALVGESGCGKSVSALSVLRLLSANAQVTEGRVMLRDMDLLRVPEKEMRQVRGTRISMIFQDPMTSLNPVVTVGSQIGEAVLVHQKMSSSVLKKRVIELIVRVGIADAEACYGNFPHQLSGGMRQRIIIAIALANEPELLIADEPTTALDVTIQAQILQLLKDLQHQLGMALWIITHDLGIVADIADKVAVMYAGELVEVASRDEFFEHYSHPYSQRLFDAVPQLEKRHEALITLPGSVPSLRGDFSGCRFAARCDLKQQACAEKRIEWETVSDTHIVRCLRSSESRKSAVAVKLDTQDIKSDSAGASLSVKNLKIYFPIKKGFFKRTVGYVKAVDDVTFTLKPGTTTALVGESGCGKTTLAKGLLKLLPVSSGEIIYKGHDLTQLSEHAFRPFRRQLQIIFQDPFSSMNPRMLVGEILEEGLRALQPNLSDKKIQQHCEGLLQRVGLEDNVRMRYPHEFSGGQRQRLCIARALAVNPSIVVCDEPTSALDVSVQAQVLNLLKSLQLQDGLSYLFISHDLSVVSYLADTVAVMYLGRIVEMGGVEQIMKNPAHPYTQALIDAVPSWDSNSGKPIIKLSDNLPSPAHPPSGCHFHTRCPQMMPECQQIKPEVISLTAEHKVACLLYKK